MTLEERAELYRLLVSYSVQQKYEQGKGPQHENKFDECAVEILQVAKKRGELDKILKIIEF